MNLKSALKPALTLTALLSLSACTAPEQQTGAQPDKQASAAQASSAAQTASASPVPETGTGTTTPTGNTDKIGGTLKVITHDSFALSDGMIEGFEKSTGVNVELIKAGDAGQMLNRLILTKQAPLADVVYGLDNSMLPRARAEDLLMAYRSPALSGVPSERRLDESGLLNTVDYGVVALNYDRDAWAKTGLPLPQTLDELKGEEYASRLVVPSPATSSPGLAFLMATVNELGEEGAWAWWNEAENNGMKTVSGWSDAYNTEFTRAGGRYPLVLSYGSSPAAEVFYAEGYDPARLPAEAPTANLFIPGTSYLQLEGVGILKSTGNEAAAKAFVDWMLSPEVQRDIPTNMWVYPAAAETPLDPVFALAETTELSPVKPELTENPQALVDAWVENVQRR
ncbi:thiamine ABC transporter substrate-binding protein [Deinococcus sp. SL84]|uniref:thiamine ABC transporter substrate-binding protein n=1 Tax=Deinococcus sp. SL84 TaxID=2994663 RepID=UPI002275FE27|nr:thiamine ABC transporter substrate-binding protein [Deinococcus sp. SL84]MCY1702387.1 thiamine ABC transporter substrate-binding protein [Deinococcus sp. SL84]